MNEFRSLISDYFNKYLSLQRGLSENTIKTYRDCFVELFEYMKFVRRISPDRIRMEHFNYDIINSFLDYLEEERGVSTSTRNNRLAAIKSFFRYISYHEPKYLELSSSVLAIQQKKCQSKPMNYLSIESFQYLITVFNRNDLKEFRDLCIVLLLYESGARVSELTNIKMNEFKQTAPHTVILHGKGNKSRIVPVDKQVANLITKYIKFYSVGKEEFLFMNSRRERLTREGVNYILQNYFKRAKNQRPDLFPDSISPHCLRHSKAMHLLENGVGLIYIRDILGHVSVTTTEIYSKVNPEIKRKHIEEATKQLIGDEINEYSEVEKSKLIDWLKTIV